MKIWAILALGLLASVAAKAAEVGSFVDIGNGEKLFANYIPAKNGAKTIVFLNGLTYDTSPWATFAADLQKLDPDLGILRYDMKGMGETLLAGPLPVNYDIPYQDQVRQLKALVDVLGIQQPEVLGLSYGGAIALAYADAYPNDIDKLILMSPFTEPLKDEDTYIKKQVASNRMAFPLNPATDKELYNYYLREFIYATFPAQEPSVLANPYILEAVYRMTVGVGDFLASGVVNLPVGRVHLMVANQDQYLLNGVLDTFWNAVPALKRGSRVNIQYSEHKIPEAVPTFAAGWVYEILHNPEISGGKVFAANGLTGEVHSGSETIALPKP